MTNQQAEQNLTDATRLRLIEAAGKVFAEQGFKAATVRDICAMAGANVAAVNYHFGGKEGLYSEVLRFAHRKAVGQSDQLAAVFAGKSPEERLRMFVSGFLMNLFSEGEIAWYSRLMTREMVDPTSALEDLLREEVCPRRDLLIGIVGELIGPGATREQIEFCSRSVIGQMVFYVHCRPVIERMFPNFHYTREDIARVADHVARLSLAGIRNYLGDVKQK